MDIFLLDSEFGGVSKPIDDFSYLEWNQRYYSSGDFTLEVKNDFFPTFKNAKYIYNSSEKQAAVIESMVYKADDKSLSVKGRMLESLFDLRVINEPVISTGTLANVIFTIVTRYAVTSPRAIPHLALANPKPSFNDSVSLITNAGKTLSSWLYETLKPHGMSYSITYNYADNSMIFTIFRGLNRTQDQTINTYAVFSSSFENISHFSYSRSERNYRNFAYVIKENDYNHGLVKVEVDKVPPNGERRETYLRSAVSSYDGVNNLSLAQFRNVLAAKGNEKLANLNINENISGSVNTLVCGINYNLGDLCDISDQSISYKARISEISHIYSNGFKQIIPKFY